MTLYSVQLPLRKWTTYVDDIAARDAISDLRSGMLSYVADEEALYVYDGLAWVLLFGGYYSFSNESVSAAYVELTGYTFPDPGVITEAEGNEIFDVFVEGSKLFYKSSATIIGQFHINNVLGRIIFPIALDGQRVQVKAKRI